MAQLFRSTRFDKKSFVELLAMIATIEHFYHQGRNEALQNYLSDPKNILRVDLNNKEETSQFNPATLAVLQLKNTVEKLSTINVYDSHVNKEMHSLDIHASDVGKQQAFKALVDMSGKKSSLLNELVLEVKGDHLPELINRFKTLKSEGERATYLATLANRPENPSNKPQT